MRPCTCEQLESCRLCWLYHNDLRYQRLWGGEPGIMQKATNFIGAVARHAANGFKAASEEEKGRRQTICQACPELVDGRCRKCGCVTAIKAAWESEQCPLGRWGKP